jgi:Leucine-rich repeat (LRR) protein
LSRRGLGKQEATLLKEVIIANPHLVVLKLPYNNLGDEGVSILASAVLGDCNNRHHNLSVFDLGFNSIGDIGCGSLALRCIAGNFNLQKLCLAGNQFGQNGAVSIAAAILHGTGLRTIHLTANHVGPIGMKALAVAVAKNEARILHLVSNGDADGALMRPMEELHLGSTSITSDGFSAIPPLILLSVSLRALTLSDNNLDDHDALLLSQALSQNKQIPLESLYLSFNCITCLGVECLMNSIWGSATLRELKLDNNKIKDRGAQLCGVAMTSIALRTLDLSFNRVSTIGVKALMKNLSENSSLRSLAMSGIPLDHTASKAVSYALAYNTSLTSLYLDNCSTGYSSQRHIVAGAVSNCRSSLCTLAGFGLSRKFLVFLHFTCFGNYGSNVRLYCQLVDRNCNDPWNAMAS